MSAYVIDREHIAYLVNAAMSVQLGIERSHMSWYWNHDRQAGTSNRAELRTGDYDEGARVGQMLWDECLKSVRARYPGDDHGQLPGPVGEDYVFTKRDLRVFADVEAVQLLKAIDCYVYQTCEHVEWPISEAWAFVHALRARAIHSLPGYDKAEWGAPKSAYAPV